MTDFIVTAFADPITRTFCAAILGIAVITVVQVLRAKARAESRIRGVRELIDTDGPVRKEHRSGMRRKALESGSDVGHLWQEFDETLVEGPDGNLLNTHDADYYFRSDSMAPELLHSRILLTRPAVLTVIGVLGTFFGLVVGLTAIEIDGDADQLTEGVRELIGGASVAFVTSVAGVFFSIVVAAIEKWASRSIDDDVRSLQAFVDERFEKQTSEASLVSIMRSSATSEEHLATLGEQIGRSLQEAVAPAMEKMAQQAAHQSEEVFERLVGKFHESFSELGSGLAERLDESTRGLSDTIGYLGEKLAEQADEHHARMTEIREATRRQVELLEERLPAVVDRLDAVTDRLDDVSRQLTPAAAHLQATAQAFESTSERFSGVLAESVESLDRISEQQARATHDITVLSQRLDGLTESAVSAAGMLEGASSTLREGIEGIDEQQKQLLGSMRDQQSSFLEGMRTHQDEVLTRLRTEVEGFSDSLSAWFTQYSEAVTNHTRERMDVWNEQTHAYTSSMLDAAKALSATVEEIDTALQRRDDDVTGAAA
ncbi:anti-phage ZorAB system protein ZorA [Isoptericola haloaureus]|uniref:Anti-phage ZorAB system protein ZorA n=1 Tax=Isoptericola haloaureus TaxID=1542902 RepID=A0ABU7Z8N1_9MICO